MSGTFASKSGVEHGASARSHRSVAGRLLASAGVISAAMLWWPPAVHLSVSWGELHHELCHGPLLPEGLHLALLMAATFCEGWTVVHEFRRHHRTRVRAGLLAIAWMSPLVLAALCKVAHLLLSWGLWIGAPCGATATAFAVVFSTPVQVAVMLAATGWSLWDLALGLATWVVRLRRRHRLACQLQADVPPS